MASELQNVIPANIAALHRVTDSGSGRYALSGIHLKITKGKYIAEATNARCAIQVKGECVSAEQEQPTYRKRRLIRGATVHKNKTIASPKDVDAIIPAGDLRKALGLSSDKKKRIGIFQNCDSVHIAVDESRSVISPIVDGRFPKVDAVIPSAKTGIESTFSPKLLIDTLTAVAQIIGPHCSVEIEFPRDSESALVIRGENVSENQSLVALVMPISRDR